MNDNDTNKLLMTQYDLDSTANGSIAKNINRSEVNCANQVEINLELNHNYQHYVELREQQLRARETGSKPMYY